MKFLALIAALMFAGAVHATDAAKPKTDKPADGTHADAHGADTGHADPHAKKEEKKKK